jgi:hypothetical protein
MVIHRGKHVHAKVMMGTVGYLVVKPTYNFNGL